MCPDLQFVLERPHDYDAHFILGEGVESENLATGEEGGDNLKGGIFRSGADKGDGAILDIGQNGILLSLVEAVNLIDKEDSSSLV